MELANGQVTDRPWGQTLGALGRRKLDGQLTLMTADGKQYQVAFERGAVVGATSPLIMDSVVRVALTSHLITSSQVSQVVQAIAASPDDDELDVLVGACRLGAEQGLRLRQRVIAQRAARTFAVESGYFVVDQAVTIPVVHAAAVDVRAIVYLGVRMNLSEHRLAMDLRQLGSHFVLKPEAIGDVEQYGLSLAELPIVDALQGGATVPELEARHRDIDPRSMRSVIYALVSCFACDATGSGDDDVPNFVPIVPRTSSADGVFIKPMPRATAMGSSSIPRTTTDQLVARTATSDPVAPRAPTPGTPSRPRTPSDPVRSRIPHDDDIARPRVATPNRPTPSRTATRQIPDPQASFARAPSPTAPPASRTVSPSTPPASRTVSPTTSRNTSPTTPPARAKSPTAPATSRTASPTAPPASRTFTPSIGRTPSQPPAVSRTTSRNIVRAPSLPEIARTPSDSLPPFDPDESMPLTARTSTLIPRTITSRGVAEEPRHFGSDALAIAAEAYQRGQAALRDDQIPLAIEELARAAELNPHEFDYAAMLAWAQFCGATDRPKIADKARKMLNHAIQKSQNPELARFYLGRMERMLGRDREALRHFQQVVEQQPRNTDAASEIRSLEAKLASGSGEKPSLSSLFGRKKT